MFTTRQAAKKLRIDATTLSRYVAAEKVPPPRIIELGGFRVHAWSEEDIERVRALLPKIANGRKTRYQKLRKEQKQGAQAGEPGPQKPRKAKKKK